MSNSKVVVTNADLMPIAEALAVLGAEKFGVSFSFQLKRLIAALKTPIEVYGEMRNEIIEEFARRDTNGEKIMNADETVVEMVDGWAPKMRELNSLEAVRLAPLSAKTLVAACEAINCGISGQLLADLGPLLVDDLDGESDVVEAVPSTPVAHVNGATERDAVLG